MDSLFELAGVDGITALADHVQLGLQLSAIRDGVGRVAPQPLAGQQHATLWDGHRGENGLARTCCVQRHPVADLGEHAHGPRRLDVSQIDDALAVERRQVGALSGQLDQLLQVGHGKLREAARRADLGGHRKRRRPDSVPPRQRVVAHEPLIDECLQQAMRGADRKAAGLTQLAETDLSARCDDLLEETQRPLDRLDAAKVPAYQRDVLRGLHLFRHADNPIRLDGGGNVL